MVSKMSELDMVLNDLRTVAQALLDVCENMREFYSKTSEPQTDAEAKTKAPKNAQPKEKTVTLEDVRKVLSAKAADGKREEAKALLAKYGAAQLSAVNPEVDGHYPLTYGIASSLRPQTCGMPDAYGASDALSAVIPPSSRDGCLFVYRLCGVPLRLGVVSCLTFPLLSCGKSAKPHPLFSCRAWRADSCAG